jgi:hypothetical protein
VAAEHVTGRRHATFCTCPPCAQQESSSITVSGHHGAGDC